MQSRVGRPGGEVRGERAADGFGEQAATLGVGASAAPRVLVQQAVLDEAGQRRLHRGRRVPVDELPQRGYGVGQEATTAKPSRTAGEKVLEWTNDGPG